MAQSYRKRGQILLFLFFFLVNVKFTEKFRLSTSTKKSTNFLYARYVYLLFIFQFRSAEKEQDDISVTNVASYRIIRWIVTFDNLGATLV